MARAKYDERYHVPWVKSLAMDGKTEAEIAKSLEIARSTLNKWRKEHPELDDALNTGRDAANSQVEQSLFKRATGCKVKEKKVIVEMDKDGNQKPARIENIEREILPDTTACIFWLKNRKRDTWKDKWDVEVDTDKEIIFNIAPASQMKKEE